jgi:hypothetical protein
LKKVNVSDNQWLTSLMISELDDIGKLYQRVTVGALPDDVLLEIFDFYLFRCCREDAWQMLSHVCRRWRSVVSASPHRLQLQLLCTNRRSVQDMVDVWKGLPIVIKAPLGLSEPQDVNNIIAALKQHDRVRTIDMGFIPIMFMKRIRVMEMREPFSALTSLRLHSRYRTTPVLPDSFLGGSAPQLREIYLYRIPFPALPTLLLSTRDLVSLDLQDIPFSGYISPEALVTCLSTLTRLRSLCLEFRSPRSLAAREDRLPPRLKRILLPSITFLRFKGDSEYMEDIVAQIDTPVLFQVFIAFFNRLIPDTPLLHDFIGRTETFRALHRAYLMLFDDDVRVSLFRRDGMDHYPMLSSNISCVSSDWHLSSLVQVCNSLLSPLPTLERLEIMNNRVNWQDDMENTEWLGVLRSFTSVKDLVLYWKSIRLVAPALEALSEERVAEVLPALKNIFLDGPRPSEPVKKAIQKFIAARQLSGLPVTVHHRVSVYQGYVCWAVTDQ